MLLIHKAALRKPLTTQACVGSVPGAGGVGSGGSGSGSVGVALAKEMAWDEGVLEAALVAMD